ncbi:MAG TPA: VWA domain-containing protein [Nitriliruptoraceae bacterium]|nr:VWA domain-containing protein [Nitriliruptoraceae bacterium]
MDSATDPDVTLAWWLPGQGGWEAGGEVRPAMPLEPGGRDLRDDLHDFVATLRAGGMNITTDRVVTFMAAAAELAPVDLVDVYWAGRTTLVARPGDRGLYDRGFRTHFVGLLGEPPPADDEAAEPHTVWVDNSSGEGDDEPDDEPQPGAVASAHEQLRHRRFDHATADELVAMRRLMATIDVVVPMQRHRRTSPARRGHRMDLGRSLRQAMRTDGEVVRRVWHRRRRRQRTLVLLLDVSGSMADYSRALLQFAFTASVRAKRVEVFTFGTRLTRLTRAFEAGTVDQALDAATTAVHDWDAGTRIGESLDRLHRDWGRRGLLRGAVVVLVSDGLERGDVELLANSMERLHRQAHAVVWVNPLKADPRYEPLARGMAAALPSVDRFLSGHDVASLDVLAEVIADV